mmetsp:Transcript_74533/g.197988  ORF Transcript_74533/g.197988 Transcript_74533/m.197988 type:complete len:490 (-) Transcript_74533:146-1615(-)
MLIYDNRERFRILLQIEGGVLWRNFPRSFLIGVLTWACAIWIRWGADSFWKPVIQNTWAVKIFGTALSFAIVYRTRMAWARYWEAATQVHFMFSKWSDCYTQLMSFISTAEKRIKKSGDSGPEAEQLKQALKKARDNIAHDFSLISALATHRLTHGDISRMKRRTDVYMSGTCCLCAKCCMFWSHWKDLIVTKQALRSHDIEKAARLPQFRIIELCSRRTEVRAKLQVAPGSPVGNCFNPTYAVCRTVSEFDTMTDASFCMTTSDVTWLSDLCVLGSMSDDEMAGLDGSWREDDAYDSSSNSQPDRVNMLASWINEDINELVPLVGIPPPIMSRCYQELSNGMLGFNQATKMADIPFPFPFLQLMELLLVCYSCCLPIYAAQFTGGLFSSPILAIIVSLSFWSLSEISRELETPFADGPSQLPVIDMHERFVEVLRMMFFARRPPWEVPGTLNPKQSTGFMPVNCSESANIGASSMAGSMGEEESKKGM